MGKAANKTQESPNCDCWSPIGGKLDMPAGESPYECARRETEEEIGLVIDDGDLHCFGYISEKSYEGAGHWLMFLFECRKVVNDLPIAIDEGHLGFSNVPQSTNCRYPRQTAAYSGHITTSIRRDSLDYELTAIHQGN